MQNFSLRRSSALRKTLLTAVALCALPAAAMAKDVPPTVEGAQKLSAVFAAYLGKPADGAPSPLAVTVDGDHYAVALDLAALAAPLKASGFSMDSAVMKYALTEQDDGTWHVVGAGLPPISAHAKDTAIAYNFEGYKFDGIFDPTFASFKNSLGSVDKTAAQVHTPKLDETVALGAIQATQTGTPAANGAASVTVHEEIADLAVVASVIPKSAEAAPDAKPVPISFQSPKILADVGMDGAPFRKALDLWAFVAAHPGRPELAANEAAFKELLRALLPGDIKLAEKVEMQKIAVEAPQGAFGLTSGKFGFAASSSPGPKGSIEYHFAADGVALPPGLLPSAMQDLAPTAFNIDLKASGFDLGAGADEAINDLHLAGDGPVIAQEDGAKIFAKLKGSAPIIVELSPSHIVAPQLDVTLEGQAHLEGVRPNGALTVHVRNFDKTVAALKALGPLASPQMIGGLAMAKSLAKKEGDGVLTWVAEYGADGSIKVNGLPLGKAP